MNKVETLHVNSTASVNDNFNTEKKEDLND